MKVPASRVSLYTFFFSCCNRFMHALHQNRAQSRLLYLLNESCIYQFNLKSIQIPHFLSILSNFLLIVCIYEPQLAAIREANDHKGLAGHTNRNRRSCDKIENYLCKMRKVGHGYSSLSTGRMGEYRRLTHCAKQTENTFLQGF